VHDPKACHDKLKHVSMKTE